MSSILPFDISTWETGIHILGSSKVAYPANETVAVAILSGLPSGWTDSESSLPILRGVNIVSGFIYHTTVDSQCDTAWFRTNQQNLGLLLTTH